MTDQAAPAKKKRAAFTRTAKPIFAIVSYTDENGNDVKLDKSRLNIVLERDSGKIVELLTGDGVGSATVKPVQLPEGPKRAEAATK
jgi:hypothetical protein